MSARATAGREVYARNFGTAPAEAERIMNEHAGAAYTLEAFEAAGGPGWQGQNLTDRDRSIAVITALVAQNVTDGRLSTYLSLARRTGLDDEALTELMVLLTAYLGQPYTSLAMEAVRRPVSQGAAITSTERQSEC
ncbi:carboxymuconolactone decarboxylase family protein [Actinoplanes derwentensis]|nr:carboxymuconolactone decarboxylase family protein [Actinoplanes derwentensis]